jgi:hypothetical protein
MSLFSTFKSFFYFKNKPLGHAQTVSQMSTEAKPLGRVLPPFVVSAPPLPLELLLETVHSIWLYQHGPPPPLEANPPPLIIWALAGGLKKCTAQSYFTPCTTDVTPVKCRRKHMMLIVVFSTFKGTVPWDFYLRIFHWWTPLKPLTRFLKTFRIWLRIRWDIHDFLLTLCYKL